MSQVLTHLGPFGTGPSHAHIGEMYYDTNTNQMLVYNGAGWNEIKQDILMDDHLAPNELQAVRQFLSNKDKYEQVLREHFPEDYL